MSGDLISRSEVIRICKELGAIELDYVLEGIPENARSREASEAMATRIRCAVALMPISDATDHPKAWNTNHEGLRAIFDAAISGICANPHFFGPIMQQSPRAAIEFANSIVLEALR